MTSNFAQQNNAFPPPYGGGGRNEVTLGGGESTEFKTGGLTPSVFASLDTSPLGGGKL